MKPEELRIGNYVTGIYYNEESNEEFDLCTIMAIDITDDAEFTYWVEGEANRELYHDFIGIELTEEWLLKMGDNKHKHPFPDWIKYVHEAQNWYYWTYNKEELKIQTSKIRTL